jgi:hypothetical protein
MILSHQNVFRQYLTNRKKVMPVFPPLTNMGGEMLLIFRKSDMTFHWFLTFYQNLKFCPKIDKKVRFLLRSVCCTGIFFVLPFCYVMYKKIEHNYVTFKPHKNFGKKGYNKIFRQKCQKNQNFKFCQKLSYFVPLLPFLYFLHINRFILQIEDILFESTFSMYGTLFLKHILSKFEILP